MTTKDKEIAGILQQYLSASKLPEGAEDNSVATEAYERFAERTRVVRSSHNRIRRIFFGISAVAACVAVVVGLARFSFKAGGETTLAAAEDHSLENSLPDGSRVILSPGSTISYSDYFGKRDRNLTLEGEAFFEVVRNEKLPMVVSTSSASVKVLGTKFTFRDYPDEALATVFLQEGSVSFCGKETLFPGESASLDKKTGEISIDRVILVFDNTPLDAICRELSRAYGVQVVLADPALLTLRFSAEFNTREKSLGAVLQVLSLTNKIRYRLTENGAEIF